MLAVNNLSASYSNFQALFGISLDVRAGEADLDNSAVIKEIARRQASAR